MFTVSYIDVLNLFWSLNLLATYAKIWICSIFKEINLFSLIFNLKSLEVQCAYRKVHVLLYSLMNYYKVSTPMKPPPRSRNRTLPVHKKPPYSPSQPLISPFLTTILTFKPID